MYSFTKLFFVFAITLMFSSHSLALPYAADNATVITSARAANTCADPTLAQTVYQSFFPGATTAHVLNYLHAWENSDTINSAILFADLHPAFRAWPTQQEFTVPLFQLATADQTQFIYRIGTDAQTPPVVSGFTSSILLIAWVYSTQVCESVPLMSVFQSKFTDHYFTINSFDHDSLISDGWADDGVVAFVLPLEYS